jgi:hypothetical protein
VIFPKAMAPAWLGPAVALGAPPSSLPRGGPTPGTDLVDLAEPLMRDIGVAFAPSGYERWRASWVVGGVGRWIAHGRDVRCCLLWP